jgi:hypothetical protein
MPTKRRAAVFVAVGLLAIGCKREEKEANPTD